MICLLYLIQEQIIPHFHWHTQEAKDKSKTMKKGILKLSNKGACWSSEYLKVKETEDGIEVLGAAKRYVFNFEIFFALWCSFTFF